jgi:putative SOS response-associated peptidase YedK
MCNLYTNKKSAAEVASHFRAQVPINFNAGGGEVYPGGPGMAVREQEGQRVLQGMAWGFPLRLKSMKPGTKPKPVNNIADLTSFMWRFIAAKTEHRCIIPLTGFCEAEGEKGSKTRTWFGLKDRPIFAWAGMWKDSPEWGPVYSGLMTDCNEAVRPVHDRMPVLLHEEDYDVWLRGSLNDVMSFQGRCFPDELIEVERTAEPWFRRKAETTADR